MNLHRKYIALCCLLACTFGGVGVAAEWGAPTVSGSLGYNYRSLTGVDGADSVSHQTLGSLFVNSYIGRPWIGLADLALTGALSGSSSDGSQGDSVDSDSRILTGTLNLNMLPQSRSPFNLRYMVTDTRVDVAAVNTDAFVVLNDGDSTAKKLGLTQSYTWEAGHRLRATYDNNEWSSENNGDYSDETAALSLDMRGSGYHVIANAKTHEATRSVGSLVNTSDTLDVTHYYYPSKSWRVDTRASVYSSERGFDVPSANDQSGISSTEITQLSSFGFWRPADKPWSLSAGVRLFDMAGENDGDVPDRNESQNLNATLGGFYRYNERMRYDFSLAYMTSTSNNIDSDVNRARVGMLYQSDMLVFKEFKYQWYTNVSGDGVFQSTGEEDETRINLNASLGHNVQRSFLFENALSFRISGSQVLTSAYTDVARDGGLESDSTSDVQRLEHSITMNLNHSSVGATSYAQMTLSDGRSFGASEMDQQMVWFQVYRDQRVSRNRTLSGNLSVQYVNQNYATDAVDSEVTTGTAKVAFRETALFSVPRLGFLSDLLLSKASDEQGVDRKEWENRLDYSIGQLVSSFSHRIIEYDDRRYQVTFFRIERQF